MERGLRTKALLLSSPPGLWFRRVAVAAHLSLIVREVWRNLYEPGTFRGVLRGAWRTLTTGEAFVWPRPGAAAPPCLSAAAGADAGADAWHVGAADLAEFKWTIEQGGRPEGASEWEPMMQKQVGAGVEGVQARPQAAPWSVLCRRPADCPAPSPRSPLRSGPAAPTPRGAAPWPLARASTSR